jgi:four helix bundle protein
MSYPKTISNDLAEEPSVPYKFEKLEVWKSSLELSDSVYQIIEYLPSSENFNLKNQILRAVTSISLNIAEGSTYVTPGEQKRFIRIAIHSLVEVVAALRIIERRKYVKDNILIQKSDEHCTRLFKMLIAFERSIK